MSSMMCGLLVAAAVHLALGAADAQQLQLAASELANTLEVTPAGSAAEAYKRATLFPAENTDFKVDVFLPPTSPDEKVYYNGTRLDWSTQIGNVKVGDFTVFPVDFWAGTPHEAENPEAGVGLAAEFGCGEFGDLCAAGMLNHPIESQNGILGWEEAAIGEPFLKIGVGKLVKASDPDNQYSPFTRYEFAEYPVWGVTSSSDRVTMSSEASVGGEANNASWGYRLTTEITVGDGMIRQTTTIENTGVNSFATPHYSHNFLAVDSPLAMESKFIGPPWKISMVPNMTDREEPTTWSTPLSSYSTNPSPDWLEITSEVGEGTTLRAYFIGDENKDAADAWTATWGDLTITSTQQNTDPELYSSNIYITRTTLSPEPMQFIDLESGATSTWTREIQFDLAMGTITATAAVTSTATTTTPGSSFWALYSWVVIGVFVVLAALFIGLFLYGSNPEEGQRGSSAIEMT